MVGYPKTTGNRGPRTSTSASSRAGTATRCGRRAWRWPRELGPAPSRSDHGRLVEGGARPPVFVDFNQNAPHKTVFGAWFARPRVRRPGVDPAVVGRRRHSRPRGAHHRHRARPVLTRRRPVAWPSPTCRRTCSPCSNWPARLRRWAARRALAPGVPQAARRAHPGGAEPGQDVSARSTRSRRSGASPISSSASGRRPTRCAPFATPPPPSPPSRPTSWPTCPRRGCRRSRRWARPPPR